MESKAASLNLTKYVKVAPNRWQYCPVVRGKTGRIKQDLVLVEGRAEQRPEGYYSLDWREGGKRRRKALGKSADQAQQVQERHLAFVRARELGLTVNSAPDCASMTVAEACEEFLAETRLQRAPKTFKQYRTALAYFQEVAGKRQAHGVDRQMLLDFRQFLDKEQKLSPRTVWTKMTIVAQMLKVHGVTRA